MSVAENDFCLNLSDRALMIKGSGIRKAFDLAAEMKDVIHLALGEPDFEAPEELKMLLKVAIDEGYSHYTPNAGYKDFRAVLSEKLIAENGLDYDPNTEIISTVGGMNAIHLALLSIINPGDEVLIQDPAFVGFEPCIIMCGGIPVKVPLREEYQFRINPKDIEDRITPKTKAIIINSPHNPTGAVLTRKDVEDICELARKHDIFIISDEVYEKLVYDDREHVSFASIPGMKEQVLTVMSFSKTYCICGWRVGFAAGPSHLINNMIKFQQFDSVHPPAPMQKAIIFYLKRSKEFTDYMKKVYLARRDFMVERLGKIGEISVTPPGGALYLFINIKKLGCTAEEFANYLLTEYRIVTIAGTAFGEAGEGYIRICLTVPIEQLQVACIRLEQAIARLLREGMPDEAKKLAAIAAHMPTPTCPNQRTLS